MHGGKRGLVAPQNTFLENIVRRSSGEFFFKSKLEKKQETMDDELACQSRGHAESRGSLKSADDAV